ncbi:hypothetical protein ABPG75_007868 [Micractinium tetrahymenae]
MGVSGLWQLLEPVGLRISIEALQNKRLAVDASMWLFQFVRAMRDERGEMLRNAHVIGFFRRICKLLFHRIRPVFIFDGSTPALKQQTVATRRRRREQQSARVNRLAEKLLLNQLKQSALGKVTEAQLRKAAAGRGRGRGRGGRGAGRGALANAEQGREEQREQELAGVGDGGGGTAATAVAAGGAEPAPAQAVVPPVARVSAMRQPVRGQRKTSAPGLTAAAAAAARALDAEEGPSTSAAAAAAAAASTAADELLAAQLAAEQWDEEEAAAALAASAAAAAAGGGTGPAPELPSVFATRSEQRQLERVRRRAEQGSGGEESSGEEDELEIVLPEDGQLDPAVMSTLPPSVVLDLMMKMRERRQAENRQEFEARRAAPAAFSSFQMQTYLVGTRFRQQVSEVKDAMNASAAGGSAARRIAGEAGREYVLHKEPELLQTEAAAAAAAAAGGGSQDHAARPGAEGAAAPAGMAQRQQAPGAALTTAAGAAAAAAPAALLPGLPGKALDISFDVELEEGGSDEDLGWEDVEQDSPGRAEQQRQQQGAAPQHWRQRAAQRQKYWSLSHGFQMGRKLATWGEGDAEEGGEPGPPAADGGAADGGGGTTPGARKGLIGRSPPSRSPLKPVPEDEDGQLQEAIRRSLEDSTPGKGGIAAAEGQARAAAAGGEEEEEMDWEDADDAAAAEQVLAQAAAPVSATTAVAAAAALGGFTAAELEELAPLEEEEESDQPTQDMYQDCMELLQMFGLPYIIAPQEAEAQCAWLDYNGLVDGVVTDDNDVFLFGARRVYRHIFESKKYVEEYRSEDVAAELGVGRAELARLAQLLGGDYCEGVAGVGIVNAMEIVHAFPGPEGLRRFRQWLDAPDEELVELARGKAGRPGAGAAAKPPRGAKKRRHGRGPGGAGGEGNKEDEGEDDEEEQELGGLAGIAEADLPEHLRGLTAQELREADPEAASAAARLAAFKRTHRGVRRSWDPPASFPSAAVDQAYAEPKVDASKEKFTFGRPDVELLRQFCQSRLGWTRQQADDLLLPVAKAYDQRQSQLTLDSFLTKRERFAKIRSKRLQKAVTGVAGGEREELMLREGEEGAPAGSSASKGRKRRAAGSAAAGAAAADSQEKGAGAEGDVQQQQEQQQQEQQEGSGRPSTAKRQRRPEAGGGSGRGPGGRGRGRGGRGQSRGRGRGRGPGVLDGDTGSGGSALPPAAQQAQQEPPPEQQQHEHQQGQQQDHPQAMAPPGGSPGHPDGRGSSSQPARRQPSRGRRAVALLPAPDDA